MRAWWMLGLVAFGCSDRKPARESRAVVAPVRDAAKPPADAPVQPWMDALLARGGPGLCATIRDDSLVISRRDASGRLLETLAFDGKHRTEPVESTTFSYDAAGRLTRRVRGSNGHDDLTTELWYADGHIVRVRTHHANGTPDVNVTYRWQGKRLAHEVADTLRLPDLDDPSTPIANTIAFAGTVHEAHFYDGSPAPQPQTEYDHTYDDRGRHVHRKSVGWAGPASDATYSWDDGDHLLSMHDPAAYLTTTTRYEWRDGRVVAVHFLDPHDKETGRDEIHRDGDGRVIELLRFVSDATWEPVSSHIEGDVVVETTVRVEPTIPRVHWQYRYDCR